MALWRVLAMLLVGSVVCSAAMAQGRPRGVRGDGRTDDTAAIQSALNQTGRKGGEVYLPPGLYRLDGSLRIPTGVTLRGSWEAPHHGAWDKGSTLLVTGGRGQEDGTAAITLEQSSAFRGFTLVWPDQRWNAIVPYPWAVQGNGMHNTVENVTLVDAYQGIRIGEQPWSELHLIRNIFGCVLRRGIFIDTTSDVGRVENVHFNAHYWPRSGYPTITADGDHGGDIARYMQDHLEAFIFGRTDWEYVLNTFVFAAKIGYHFIQTKAGACNGQLVGIGADDCRACVQIDALQNIGIQVTNGEFTSFAGDPNTAVMVTPGGNGAAQFVNCNFWGITGHLAWIQGDTAVTFSACHFVDVPPDAILAEHGKLIVQGCTFDHPGTAIVLGKAVSQAVVMGNIQPGGLGIRNEIGPRAQIGLNSTDVLLSTEELKHYRVGIGTPQDADYLGAGWYGPEGFAAAPGGFNGFRWSTGDGVLKLPVQPGAGYALTAWVEVDPHATGEHLILEGGPTAALDHPGRDRVQVQIPASATAGHNTVAVRFQGATWSPHRVDAKNGDNRELGVKVFGIEMEQLAP